MPTAKYGELSRGGWSLSAFEYEKIELDINTLELDFTDWGIRHFTRHRNSKPENSVASPAASLRCDLSLYFIVDEIYPMSYSLRAPL